MRVKKILSSILVICMLLSTLGTVAFADANVIEVTNDAELATAIADAVAGDTIKLAAGEYSAFNVGGKNITVEGELGEDGEHLTVIRGGNPAITGHNFDGTIKNLKIVDAFKVFYGEPCGNIVFDNLYVTGATYGIHAVAYENGKQWIIQNCYMDISWANSFGRYTSKDAVEETEGATIIIKDNKFESTSPYYADYGAPIINTSSPYTVVEDNILGENVKIQFLNQDAATGTEIGLNYYADGVENVIVSDNEYDVPPIVAWYETEDMDEDKVAVNEIFVAKIGDIYYTTLQDALKSVTEENNVVEIVNDVTISDKWDCRNAKISVPATINGNGHIIKFAGKIDDGYNHMAAFRVVEDTTFNDLTIDMSEAISVFQNRFSAISTNGCDLTVDGCTFIGSTTYTNGRAIIFGEGGTADDAAEILVTDSDFINWRYGVVDNMNGVDVAKSVEISGSEFAASGVQISASEKVILTNNTVEGAGVTVKSYADVTELDVVANGNILDETALNYIIADEIETDSEKFNLPVADVAGKKFISIAEASKAVKAGESATITILGNVSDENVTVAGNVTIVNGAASTYSLRSTDTILNNVIFTVENGASLSLDGFAVTGLSYIYAKTPESISVTNCDIDVTTVEVSGTNCPPGYILFNSNNGGSVEFTFTNNTLLATPDATEDWYTYSHGITGWNSIEKATITGNTFGSAQAPLGAAAVKLMNFVKDAEVDVSGNTFYVNSNDSTWGPNALQLYQNNSRANNYTATINDNDFYVDDATAAIGINTNAMGKPVEYAGGGHVAIGSDNTVNNQAVSMNDIIVFGNGINDLAYTRGYVGLGIEFNANGEIIGGTFSKYSLGLADAIADNYMSETDVAGNLHIVEETLLVDEIKVEFAPASEDEGEKVYNINLTAGGDVINRLNSADLTFLFEQLEGVNDYEIIASNSEIAINPVDNSKVRYEFHYNGKTDVNTDTNATITLGQVKFTGYGKFNFAVDANANGTNAAHATKLYDNIVDTFVPGGNIAAGEGKLDISDNTINGVEIKVPTRTLTVNVTFPNAVEDNEIAYQNMKVEITGNIDGVNKTVTYNLGEDENAMVDGAYQIKESKLVVNNNYNVTVSGAGYRTARYTVSMTDDKELTFWNNVMDDAKVVETNKPSSEEYKNFLAGDIVKDNNINIYDLSAVVSYFAQDANIANGYAKYDLNRDGVVDSKDVAYVLVSWDN